MVEQGTALLTTMSMEVVGLENMKELYEEDSIFVATWKTCKDPWSGDIRTDLEYFIYEGFIFRNKYLCNLGESMRGTWHSSNAEW
jgi:hypothetical protein